MQDGALQKLQRPVFRVSMNGVQPACAPKDAIPITGNGSIYPDIFNRTACSVRTIDGKISSKYLTRAVSSGKLRL